MEGYGGMADQGSDGEGEEAMIPSQMGKKTIGVDYGLRRTGVCVSVGYAPRPLPLIQHNRDPAYVAKEVAEHARRELAEQIVVGLPLNFKGEEGEQANATRVMVAALAAAAPGCNIYLWDERFSSAVARERLAEAGYNSRSMKGLVDTVSSVGILQDFFEKGGVGAITAHEAVKAAPKEVAGGDGGGGGSGGLGGMSFKEFQAEARRKAMEEGGGGKGRKKRRK